jgi:hypothetical protein
MMSLSFMIRYSTPSILTSVPDHLRQHPVAFLEVDRDELAAFVAATRTDADHLSLSRLLFGGIRNDNSACALILGIDARDHNAVVKRPKRHIGSPEWVFLLIFLTIEQGGTLEPQNELGQKQCRPVSFNWYPLALARHDCQLGVIDSAIIQLTY